MLAIYRRGIRQVGAMKFPDKKPILGLMFAFLVCTAADASDGNCLPDFEAECVVLLAEQKLNELIEAGSPSYPGLTAAEYYFQESMDTAAALHLLGYEDRMVSLMKEQRLSELEKTFLFYPDVFDEPDEIKPFAQMAMNLNEPLEHFVQGNFRRYVRDMLDLTRLMMRAGLQADAEIKVFEALERFETALSGNKKDVLDPFVCGGIVEAALLIDAPPIALKAIELVSDDGLLVPGGIGSDWTPEERTYTLSWCVSRLLEAGEIETARKLFSEFRVPEREYYFFEDAERKALQATFFEVASGPAAQTERLVDFVQENWKLADREEALVKTIRLLWYRHPDLAFGILSEVQTLDGKFKTLERLNLFNGGSLDCYHGMANSMEALSLPDKRLLAAFIEREVSKLIYRNSEDGVDRGLELACVAAKIGELGLAKRAMDWTQNHYEQADFEGMGGITGAWMAGLYFMLNERSEFDRLVQEVCDAAGEQQEHGAVSAFAAYLLFNAGFHDPSLALLREAWLSYHQSEESHDMESWGAFYPHAALLRARLTVNEF